MVQLEQQDRDQCARLRSWHLERERRRLLVAAVYNSFLKKAQLKLLSPLSSDEEDCCDDPEEEESEEEETQEEVEDGEEREEEVEVEVVEVELDVLDVVDVLYVVDVVEVQVDHGQGPGLGCGNYDPSCNTFEEYVPACRTQCPWVRQGSANSEEEEEQDSHIWQECTSEVTKDNPKEYTPDCESVWECTEEYVPEDYSSKEPWGHLASECPWGDRDCIVVKLPSDENDSDSEDAGEEGRPRRWSRRVCDEGWGHLESDCPDDACDYVVVRLPTDDGPGGKEPH